MSRQKTTAFAKAKLNLTLDILRRRSDGYHDLCMILTDVELKDKITLVKEESGDNILTSNLSFLPTDCRNIAFTAAKKFFEAAKLKFSGLSIDIQKNIPVAAGLGGGSSDAAAVLRALCSMYPGLLSDQQIMQIAGEIGSDVPFCIDGGTALSEGRGEILTPLPKLPPCNIVLCKPPICLSTRVMFERIVCPRIRRRPDTDGALDALRAGDIGGLARRMYNVFEDFLVEGKRDIADIKSVMLYEGALGAVMSGSGPSVFGIFDSLAKARAAVAKLKESYGFVFLV